MDAEARRRAAALLSGILAYRHHPYRRTLPDPPPIWAEGTARLLDYGPSPTARRARRPRPALLAVPSLINRAYILDLAPERSFLRFTAAQGVRSLLLDWDAPGAAERAFTLSDYVLRLERAIDAATAATGAPPVLLGYCMGGTLAAAAAARRPASVAGLIALAAPWDFHAEHGDAPRGTQAALAAAAYVASASLIAALGEMPVDLIQSLFAALDPALALRKFTRFAALAPDCDEARHFVALEDWLNDGVPLVPRVAEECMRGWYGDNTPCRGAWVIDGAAIAPGAVAAPALVVVPRTDRIVPPASARALAEALPASETWTPGLGHIGMMASGAAREALWRPLAAWIKNRRTAAGT